MIYDMLSSVGRINLISTPHMKRYKFIHDKSVNTKLYTQVVPIIQDLPEFKAMENDEEARRNAFSKFVKRQKEKMREAQSDDESASSRKRKEPYGSRMRDRERERERERDHERSREREHRDDKYRSHRERERDRDYGKRRDERERERERDKKNGKREEKRKEDDVEMKDGASQNGHSPTKVRSDSPEEGEI